MPGGNTMGKTRMWPVRLFGAIAIAIEAVEMDRADPSQQDPEDLREWHQRPAAMAVMAEVPEEDKELVALGVEARLARELAQSGF